ncbi:hypothetical protein [Hymenobacter sediminicola]|uniref:DUF2306 domain-containing protein n=1 Tax=Hymenobacter sediminicola TaxID=2761579 RepID=A0A7G7W8S8_9BACT|nr:hypothetical protein [Hymenobacter sediminicola]QNH62771.1 hypothetical protein H4317_02815 [Hymenobacter sediminicola]
METLLLYNRWLHIAAGFLGFFVAPAALYVRKGGAAHRLWGRVFFWAMVVAGSTAIFSAVVNGLTFLLLTGIFSLYLAWFGYRSLYLKKLHQGQRPALVDWVGVGAGLLVFGGTLAYGFLSGTVPSLVFGAIGLMTTGRQLWSYVQTTPPAPGQWLLNHISGFVGSYIAAVSAFSATSLHFIPWPWNFLWPTLLMVPPMIWVQNRYKARFRQGQHPGAVVEVRIQPEAA